jgi:hypothetical protein
MRTQQEIQDEIRRRQADAAHAFPDAPAEAFAYNLIQEALVFDGSTYRDRLDEIQRILNAVDPHTPQADS